MQVLTTNYPYCNSEVDSTIEHINRPIIWPAFHKPFEMEMPTATLKDLNRT